MTKNIIKYKNEMNGIPLRGFTAGELDLFMAICGQMKEKKSEEITLSFDELIMLVKYKHRGLERFYKDVQSTYDKLIQCRFGWNNEKEIVRFVLFIRYTVNKELQTVSVRMNPEFRYILNQLTENFTRFELEEFVNLKSSYSKELYRRLKQFRTTGKWIIGIEDFRELLDVPESYQMCNIDTKILKPALTELSPIFPNLKIEKIKDKKGRGGRRVNQLVFTFVPDAVRYVPPEKIRKASKKPKTFDTIHFEEEEIRDFSHLEE